jgi:phage terminase large subunit-like protein
VCKFIELLPHVKGRWAAHSERLVLQPWQVFILCSLFGWVHRVSGLRKYREAYICVPRKNGKSPLAAGLGLFMLCADGEYGAEVYCGATSLEQALEVFRPAKQMDERTPELVEAYGLQINAESLVLPANGSRFLPVVGKPGDGAAPSCGIADEFHEASDASLYDCLKTGMIGREQPLLLVITTAGFNTASPCHDLQTQAQKVLDGSLQDDQLFSVIYTLDEGENWASEDALHKANPNYGISVNAEQLRHDQQIAVGNAAKANTFKTKHLNIWCNASVAWLNMQAWAACEQHEPPANLTDSDCFIGLDLASKIDCAVAVKLFRKQIDGQDHYFVVPRIYLPADRALAPGCQHYQAWVADGHLIATPGNVIDYGCILADLQADATQYHVRQLGFDPWNATDITQRFAAATSVQIVEVPQTVRNLSDPMKQLQALVLAGRLHHRGNPVLTWMLANVVAHTDANDNIFPRKDHVENKIDAAVALIIALSRALATPAVPAKPQYVPYTGFMFI